VERINNKVVAVVDLDEEAALLCTNKNQNALEVPSNKERQGKNPDVQINKDTRNDSNDQIQSKKNLKPNPQNPEKRIFKYKINLNSFDIVRFLGHGAFGRVYKVRLKQTGRFYAMKVLPKEPLIKKNQIRYAKSEANI